jgi:hypothetical protein
MRGKAKRFVWTLSRIGGLSMGAILMGRRLIPPIYFSELF